MDSLPISFARANNYQENGPQVLPEDTITDCRKTVNGDCHFITAPDTFAGKVLKVSLVSLFQDSNRGLLRKIQQDLKTKGLKPLCSDLEKKYIKEGLSVDTVKDIYCNASTSVTSEDKGDFVVISQEKITPQERQAFTNPPKRPNPSVD